MTEQAMASTSSAWSRLLEYTYDFSDAFSFYGYNKNSTSDFDAQLKPAEDVSVSAVLSSLVFNSIAFLMLMVSYECLRRLLPTVYSSRKRLDRIHLADNVSEESQLPQQQREKEGDEGAGLSGSSTPYEAFPPTNDDGFGLAQHDLRQSGLLPLPDDKPLDWVGPVFGVPWKKVRQIAGLDGYFFLRYIRMNVRITAVSTFWFFAVLVPIYATGGGAGGGQYQQQQDRGKVSTISTGWYYFSAANVPIHSWRIWAPCIFCYLFSAFIIFVVKQEYRHFLEMRQDFLAKGTAHVDPQQHYSMMIENVPYELRSDRALKEYFEKLFPGRVHSASVVMKLPDLEELSARCIRTCRRLEKSIAYLIATGNRPTHIAGRGRLNILGVDMAPMDCSCTSPEFADDEAVYIEDGRYVERPGRGTRVDSISYYTQELAADSRALFKMQIRKGQIAESGNLSLQADNWFSQNVRDFSAFADTILDDSVLANDLVTSRDGDDDNIFLDFSPGSLMAENMSSCYGSFSPEELHSADHMRGFRKDQEDNRGVRLSPVLETNYKTPFASDQYRSRMRRWAGRLGLDFVVAVFKTVNKELDVALEGVIGATMSSTGFVTFLDLASTTCAASAPLTAKATILDASIAPEPREIRWQNAHVSKQTQENREIISNFVLFIGAIFWSFPLAAIQAFAKAEYLAQIPGLEWIETVNGGAVSTFVNGYLPVVGLLGFILILPVLFEYIAVHYEHRKTFTDIQSSMMGRYFYYQLVNVYVSVTAGSLLKSLGDIIDQPMSILELLGESLPSMVGYFVALLVTKIMAGLPMVFLRFGALSRMLLLRCVSNEPKLTQRELDSVYRLENVQYGWEFPTQLLVVVIVFTYAVICPAILPVGLIYFVGALIVYKKQVLYVYSPVYESGGAIFPLAVQRTLFGLVCSQMTLIGYLTTRGSRYPPLFLAPLPVVTIIAMNYFHKTYVEPSSRLSLERAREYDRMSAMKNLNGSLTINQEDMDQAVEMRRRQFDKSAYQQPVLTELAAEPMFYRRGVEDEETVQVRGQLRQVNRYVSHMVSAGRGLGLGLNSGLNSIQSPIV